MRQAVIVEFEPQHPQEIDLHAGTQPLDHEAARRWLDEQFLAFDCEPLRPTGKVLTADKVLALASAAGPSPTPGDASTCAPRSSGLPARDATRSPRAWGRARARKRRRTPARSQSCDAGGVLEEGSAREHVHLDDVAVEAARPVIVDDLVEEGG